ncbi:MAG: FkbM family methyltransferase [Caldilineaceae bacterium]|nr:FkbM family methyltransferase [Caldilineaceae bacterium]
MNTSLIRNLSRQWGLVRSLIIYYAQPWRRVQARRFYTRYIRRGDLCFDVGAHVGSRLSLWAGMGARVVALEPLPHCMALLRRLYGGRPNVVLVEAAAGTEPGHATIHLDPTNPTIATLSQQWIAAVQRRADFAHVTWDEAIDVPVITLDSLIAQHGVPVFCKIDVEGFEHAVLQGLSQPIPMLSLEYTPADIPSSLACIDRLCELGDYAFNWSTGEGQHLHETQWLSAAEMRAILEKMHMDDPSGDFYARLRT